MSVVYPVRVVAAHPVQTPTPSRRRPWWDVDQPAEPRKRPPARDYLKEEPWRLK